MEPSLTTYVDLCPEDSLNETGPVQEELSSERVASSGNVISVKGLLQSSWGPSGGAYGLQPRISIRPRSCAWEHPHALGDICLSQSHFWRRQCVKRIFSREYGYPNCYGAAHGLLSKGSKTRLCFLASKIAIWSSTGGKYMGKSSSSRPCHIWILTVRGWEPPLLHGTEGLLYHSHCGRRWPYVCEKQSNLSWMFQDVFIHAIWRQDLW